MSERERELFVATLVTRVFLSSLALIALRLSLLVFLFLLFLCPADEETVAVFRSRFPVERGRMGNGGEGGQAEARKNSGRRNDGSGGRLEGNRAEARATGGKLYEM